jgi:dTDP-4-dehydrorhamnose reductase
MKGIALWAEIAKLVFDEVNDNGSKIVPVTTAQYMAYVQEPVPPRPVNSALEVTKLSNTGYTPADWRNLYSYT